MLSQATTILCRLSYKRLFDYKDRFERHFSRDVNKSRPCSVDGNCFELDISCNWIDEPLVFIAKLSWTM
jgi:hypothetical protein